MLTCGAFVPTVIDFLLIAFVIFMIIKACNRMQRPADTTPTAPTWDVLLLRGIRDQLATRPG